MTTSHNPPQVGSAPRSSRSHTKTPAGVADKARALYGDLRLDIEYVPVDSLKAYARTLRTHSRHQLRLLADSIAAFGLVTPILIDANATIVGGHGVLAAAKQAGYAEVPVVRLAHLSDAQKRALRIGLNRLAELAGWDRKLLALEFNDLLTIESTLNLDFGLTITGFSAPEIDQIVEDAKAESAGDDATPEPDTTEPPVSRLGDLWHLGHHRLICGDAREAATYDKLLGGERAAMGLHDAPYDVPISGHVAKPGRHREFIMGAGELGENFAPFLTAFLAASTAHLAPGGYQFCFMDWRHIGEMLRAGQEAGLELKNLCVWNKGAGAMGSLYRSQHELVFVFREPSAPGLNNVQLGKFGRNRTNVWDHPGAASLRQELKLHPTPKPVSLLAEAIRDVSHRGDIVLDSFSGSGSTIIAAAKTGRRGYAVELDPHYVDVAVRRWEQWSGGTARYAETGLTFAEIKAARAQESAKSRPDASSEAAAAHPSSAVRVRQRARAA